MTDLIEELASLPTFHHPTASPDGTEIALYYDGSGRNELYVLDVETAELTRVSDGEVPRNARWWVRWDETGDSVYFHLDDGGNEQNDLHRIDRDGAAERVVETPAQASLYDVADDGTLYYGSNEGGQMNLYRRRPDAEPEQVTDYERAVWFATVSPDGERVAYATNETDVHENRDAYVANADGSEPRTLGIGEVGAEAGPVDWAPDGDRLLVGDNSPDKGRVGIYDLRSESVTWFGDEDVVETPVEFVDDERFLAVRTERATDRPVVYDVETGDSRPLDLPAGVATFPQVGRATLADDRVLLTYTTPTSRPELLAYDLSTDEYEVLLAAEYGDVDPDSFADADYFRFESDGVAETPARAVELEPKTTYDIGAILYDAGERPSPLVVKPHGGPRGADKRAFDLYTQVLCSQGYSVLEVNYRGSTGRGREFVRSLDLDWGGAEQADVARGVEEVLATHDWLDEDRVAVFGGSYGGYSAYWQLVQYPDLYTAGVAWIGLTDLEEMYETTMPHFRTELMETYLGTPEENPDLYRERSPITHAGNVAAPLFLVHGVNDRRVPVSQARLFRERLDDLGYDGVDRDPSADDEAIDPDADYEYAELGEEGHASSDIDQKIRMFHLLVDFLDRRV